MEFDSLVSDKTQVLAKMPQKQHNDIFFFKNGLNSKLSSKCTILSRRFAGPLGRVGDLPGNPHLVSSVVRALVC